LESSRVDALRDIEMLVGFPEFKVSLPGGARASQSDVFVLARSTLGLVCMTVEGKMRESFGETVGEWSEGASSGKVKRLDYLCGVLGVGTADTQSIPYQLLHRTASALILAERFGAPVAATLVHSFSPDNDGFNEFAEFARAMGAEAEPDQVAEARGAGGRRLFLGWVRDSVVSHLLRRVSGICHGN